MSFVKVAGRNLYRNIEIFGNGVRQRSSYVRDKAKIKLRWGNEWKFTVAFFIPFLVRFSNPFFS